MEFPLPALSVDESRYPAIDPNYAHSWVYPHSLEKREYQHSIVHTALFTNTLVVLPTGLGSFSVSASGHCMHSSYIIR